MRREWTRPGGAPSPSAGSERTPQVLTTRGAWPRAPHHADHVEAQLAPAVRRVLLQPAAPRAARSRRALTGPTASAGSPNAVPLRVFTSQNTTVPSGSRATRSSSPSRQRQLRSSTHRARRHQVLRGEVLAPPAQRRSALPTPRPPPRRQPAGAARGRAGAQAATGWGRPRRPVDYGVVRSSPCSCRTSRPSTSRSTVPSAVVAAAPARSAPRPAPRPRGRRARSTASRWCPPSAGRAAPPRPWGRRAARWAARWRRAARRAPSARRRRPRRSPAPPGCRRGCRAGAAPCRRSPAPAAPARRRSRCCWPGRAPGRSSSGATPGLTGPAYSVPPASDTSRSRAAAWLGVCGSSAPTFMSPSSGGGSGAVGSASPGVAGIGSALPWLVSGEACPPGFGALVERDRAAVLDVERRADAARARRPSRAPAGPRSRRRSGRRRRRACGARTGTCAARTQRAARPDAGG